MSELLTQFAALDPGLRASIMLAVAGGLVTLARALGLKCAPGLVTILAAVLTGAALGYVTGGWQGVLLGVVAGLAATGSNQIARQADKFEADKATLHMQVKGDAE